MTETVDEVPSRCQIFLAVLKRTTVEPALFLYMISSYLHIPVFQSLIYEKVCLHQYDDHVLCQDYGATSTDHVLQTSANYLFMLSSVCLGVSAFIPTILLGSYGDRQSKKIALLFPYVGLILGDVNYLVQSTYIEFNVYYLLISDLIYGLLGGYSSVLSTSFSYGAKDTEPAHRSYRMALLEGSIGAGGTIGSLLSGFVLSRGGYRSVFLTNTIIHFAAVCYICIFIKDTDRQQLIRPKETVAETSSDNGSPTVKDKFTHQETNDKGCSLLSYFKEAAQTVIRRRSSYKRQIIIAILVAFCVSFLVFTGSQDIMFYYLRYKLQWTSTTYGIFKALYFGLGSLATLLLFPLLKYYGVADWALAIVGLLSRLVASLMLAFAFSTWFVFIVPLFYTFNRFAATGMRAIVSKQTEKNEQGKIFAAIALIEAICTLVATSIFNTLYPQTLSFFPGFSYVLCAVLMLIPLGLLLFVRRRLNQMSQYLLNSPISDTSNTVGSRSTVGESVTSPTHPRV